MTPAASLMPLAHWNGMDSPPSSLGAIGDAIQSCRRCPIGCNGTNAVMGEGPPTAPLMVVGEQPGDVEEQQGRPFVGPAGKLLRARMETAGIDDRSVYITNAVKHFKFTLRNSPRGKRRLHQSPTSGEIDICRWWLDGERALIQPRLILTLGTSAGRGVLGKPVAIGRMRGRPYPLEGGAELWITAHPSYLLRLKDELREEQEALFAQDLRQVASRLAALRG